MKNFKILFVLALTFLVSACANAPEAVAARGEGLKRVYAKDYIVVWEAAINAVNQTDLVMVSEDKKAGTIIAKAEVSQTSYGESIAIFVKAVPQKRTTQVEIVNKRASVARLFTRDWEGILAKQLDDALN